MYFSLSLLSVLFCPALILFTLILFISSSSLNIFTVSSSSLPSVLITSAHFSFNISITAEQKRLVSQGDSRSHFVCRLIILGAVWISCYSLLCLHSVSHLLDFYTSFHHFPAVILPTGLCPYEILMFIHHLLFIFGKSLDNIITNRILPSASLKHRNQVESVIKPEMVWFSELVLISSLFSLPYGLSLSVTEPHGSLQALV